MHSSNLKGIIVEVLIHSFFNCSSSREDLNTHKPQSRESFVVRGLITLTCLLGFLSLRGRLEIREADLEMPTNCFCG